MYPIQADLAGRIACEHRTQPAPETHRVRTRQATMVGKDEKAQKRDAITHRIDRSLILVDFQA